MIFLFSALFCSCNQKRSPDKVSDSFKADIRNFMLEFIGETDVPSMGFAFYSDTVGTVMLAVGEADCENSIPLSISTLYPIQSTTKMFLSIVTLQLVEEGKLSLGSTIDQWTDGVPNSNKITINNLLQHTSGLNQYQSNTKFMDEYYSRSKMDYVRNDFINAALAIPYNPGDYGIHKYSNTNFLILASIIETVTKHSIGEEYRHRIILPANMCNTYYKPEISGDTNTIIKCYRDGRPVDLERINFASNAAGGIISNLSDMMLFAHWVLENEYYIPMSSGLIDNFTVDGIIFKYGLGMEVITNMYGTTLQGHAGGNPGFIHELYFSTETNEIIVFFFNQWPNEVEFHFRDKLETILQKYRS